MAFRTPVVLQNENLPIRIGKHVDTVRLDVPKPARTGRKDRKALQDLSNTGKPPISKGSILKEKSAASCRETKNSTKNNILTDEEIKQCHEWAKEGIEKAHFTGNDLQNLQKELDEKRVNKEVEKVMSALREWSNFNLDFVFPLKEAHEDTKEMEKMEMEPEVLPCSIIKSLSTTGNKGIDDLILEEVDDHPFLDCALELELKEDSPFEA